jgi:hypothetical protein
MKPLFNEIIDKRQHLEKYQLLIKPKSKKNVRYNLKIPVIKLLFITMIWLLSESFGGKNPNYLAIVKSYAKAMMKDGRDVYGKESTPLFAAALDRTTMKLGSLERFGSIPDVREVDRALGGANPQQDAHLYAILYELTELTGRKKYAREADKALEFFFTHCQSPETGLMAWGEHLFWDFHQEACGNKNDWHEVSSEWLFWDKCTQLTPEACWRFAIGQWDHQIFDKKTGDFSRHAGWSMHKPGSGFEFPRYAGQMIVNWADAYGRKEHADRTRREELVTAIATVVGRMEANSMLTKSGYLPAGRQEQGSHINVVWLNSNLELAQCLWKAAPNLDEEHEKLAKRMRNLALKQDSAFFKAPHKVAFGGGFALTLDATTGEPRSRSTNRPYTEVWATGYGYSMHASLANLCYTRYEQLSKSHQEFALNYHALILATAVQYLSAIPDRGTLQKPASIASVIELMLNAYYMTRDKKFIDRAYYFGQTGIDLFLDDGLPLPKASNKSNHYEAITGGPSFMYELLQLVSLNNLNKTR